MSLDWRWIESFSGPLDANRLMEFHGFLNVSKPRGISSRGAVNVVQRLVRPSKVGHAGTLDPMASGVLVVAIGRATRLVEYLHRFPKGYRAEFALGRSSPTDDTEGEITMLEDAPLPSLAEVRKAAEVFVGTLWQTPPVFSAVKVGGKRSYRMARKGRAVALSPRAIEMHRCEVISYEYPHLVLDIECGSGTYVRAIGRDLATALGTRGVMTALERTFVGPFDLASSVELEAICLERIASALKPMRMALSSLADITIDDATRRAILHGREITLVKIWEDAIPTELAAIDDAGQLVAILNPIDAEQWRPVRCFASP